MDSPLSFNKSVRIEARRERITGDAGAVTGREVLRQSGVVRWMARKLADARDPRKVRHPLADLLRTALLLVAQGRREGALAMAVSNRKPKGRVVHSLDSSAT